jgi:hypothetical protein
LGASRKKTLAKMELEGEIVKLKKDKKKKSNLPSLTKG